jgi:hypothetical protein
MTLFGLSVPCVIPAKAGSSVSAPRIDSAGSRIRGNDPGWETAR